MQQNTICLTSVFSVPSVVNQDFSEHATKINIQSLLIEGV